MKNISLLLVAGLLTGLSAMGDGKLGVLPSPAEHYTFAALLKEADLLVEVKVQGSPARQKKTMLSQAAIVRVVGIKFMTKKLPKAIEAQLKAKKLQVVTRPPSFESAVLQKDGHYILFLELVPAKEEGKPPVIRVVQGWKGMILLNDPMANMDPKIKALLPANVSPLETQARILKQNFGTSDLKRISKTLDAFVKELQETDDEKKAARLKEIAERKKYPKLVAATATALLVELEKGAKLTFEQKKSK